MGSDLLSVALATVGSPLKGSMVLKGTLEPHDIGRFAFQFQSDPDGSFPISLRQKAQSLEPGVIRMRGSQCSVSLPC